MNRVMWGNPAVQSNRRTLEERGVRILGPGEGSQACGETGAGRMLEPDEIASIVCGPKLAAKSGERLLDGKTVMVTAGPTREAIDPVRYITNRSSGKMGYAIATAAREQGAKVILVSGPVSLTTEDEKGRRVDDHRARQVTGYSRVSCQTRRRAVHGWLCRRD